MNVLGKRIEKASTKKCYRAEFKKQKGWKKMRVFLKLVYFINFACLLVGLLIVTLRQETGYYYCKSVTVQFEDMIWDKALVKFPQQGEYHEFMLNYGNFNGVYELSQSDGILTPPVYVERRKFDQTEFESVEPATIKYCGDRDGWVLSHPYIHKRRDLNEKDFPCDALAMSPPLDDFDLQGADNKDWLVWTGVISYSNVKITCNECYADKYSEDEYNTLLSGSSPITRSLECNLNGVCVENKCKCDNEEDTEFRGAHCGILLEKECATLLGERYNDKWSFVGGLVGYQYNRPVYTFTGNMSHATAALGIPADTALMNLVFGGDRWIGYYQSLRVSENTTDEDAILYALDYHAFWSYNYHGTIAIVSDPTTNAIPVGVDMYAVGRKGKQFGPYGELIPLQLYNQTGRGYFSCGWHLQSGSEDLQPE